MKKQFLLFASALLLTACSKPYSVTVDYGNKNDGMQVYLQNYFTGEIIDSTTFADGKAVFNGKTGKNYIAQATFADKSATFVLEPGDINITFNPAFDIIYEISGTEQNDSLAHILDQAIAYQFGFLFKVLALDSNAPDFEKTRDSITAANNDTLRILYKTGALKYADKPIGDYCSSEWLSYTVGTDEFDEALSNVSSRIKKSAPVQKSITVNNGMKANQPGSRFIDFTIENGNIDGTPVSLSDYVGNGKYVLVDFWASWCAPCRGGIPGIKELYKKYAGENFEVVSVAVWDERAATLKALEEEQMPWPQIIDAQEIPSNIYGFTGIPQVILFSPDGTIIARDLHGKAIDEAVEKALKK